MKNKYNDSNHSVRMYCMYKKYCPFAFSELTTQIKQDFLDTQCTMKFGARLNQIRLDYVRTVFVLSTIKDWVQA